MAEKTYKLQMLWRNQEATGGLGRSGSNSFYVYPQHKGLLAKDIKFSVRATVNDKNYQDWYITVIFFEDSTNLYKTGVNGDYTYQRGNANLPSYYRIECQTPSSYGANVGPAYIEYTITSITSIDSLSPSGGQFPISQAKSFTWKTDVDVSDIASQTIYYRLATESEWKSVNVGTSSTGYTFAKNFFKEGQYYWYVSVKDKNGTVVNSNTAYVIFGSRPSVTLNNPSNNGTIWRSIANAFQWTYKSGLNLVQTAWEIGYKLTSSTTWTTISGTGTTSSYTYAANFFEYTKYNFRVRVKDEDGLWSDYQTITFQAGSIPSISINSPDNNAVLRKSTENAISWKFSDTLNTGQKAYEYRYRLSNETTWISSIVYTTSETLHSIPADSLTPGKYAWQLRSQNNDGNWTDWTNERQFTYGCASKLTLISPLDGDNIRLLASTTVSWSSENDYDLPQKSYELAYKKNGTTSWTTIEGTTAESYTLASGLLTYDYYNFRLRIQNVDNVWTEWQYFNCQVGSIPTLSITYPIECNIKRDIQQIFTWELDDSLNTGQKSFEFAYKHEDGEWVTVTGTDSKEYYSFVANTFTAGDYEWKLRITNNDGIQTDYIYAQFTVIGTTAAPVISSVTQSAIPTIKWTVASQDTFEFELFSKGERIYTSGVQKGSNIRQYTPNIMIADGNYLIKIRCMNEYGYFTEWMSYSFVLSTQKPSALPCYIFANKKHGVTIARSLELDPVVVVPVTSTSPTPDAYYVLRRKKGDKAWDIIGKLDVADETVKFEDNTVQKNIEYEYAIRNYKEEAGYTDSAAHLIMIRHKGIIIYNGDEYVNLYYSEGTQFDIKHTPSKNFSYAQMIGRTYPVRESSDWLNHSTSFTCYVTIEQYQALQSYMISNNDLWFKGKDFSFACAIDSISIKAAHLDKGYDIEISLSRINEEDFVLC